MRSSRLLPQSVSSGQSLPLRAHFLRLIISPWRSQVRGPPPTRTLHAPRRGQDHWNWKGAPVCSPRFCAFANLDVLPQITKLLTSVRSRPTPRSSCDLTTDFASLANRQRRCPTSPSSRSTTQRRRTIAVCNYATPVVSLTIPPSSISNCSSKDENGPTAIPARARHRVALSRAARPRPEPHLLQCSD